MSGGRLSRRRIMSAGWPATASRPSSICAAEQTFGTRWLEQQACARHGVKLVDLELRSRAAPKRNELQAMQGFVGSVEYPILVHCKSGADRAGLMSLIDPPCSRRRADPRRDGPAILRYGHFRSADTGVLDAVFDRYLEDAAKTGIEFLGLGRNRSTIRTRSIIRSRRAAGRTGSSTEFSIASRRPARSVRKRLSLSRTAEARIGAVARQKLGVGSPFDDVPGLHHANDIGVLHGR